MFNAPPCPDRARNTSIILCALVGLSMACQPKTYDAPVPAQAMASAPTQATPTTQRGREGVLEMGRAAGYKAFQPTTLLLAGGGELLLSYRPMPEYVHLVGQTVFVEGESYRPEGQAIGGNHFRATAVTLKDSTLNLAKRDDFPPTPRLDTLEQARNLNGRWVHVHGVFNTAPTKTDRSWVNIALELKDGASAALSIPERELERSWTGLQGKPITVVVKVSIVRDEDTQPKKRGQLMLSHPMLVCEGHRVGCGPIALPKR